MTKTAFSAEIFSAAALHLEVTDIFIAIAQAKLAGSEGFARESLGETLTGLTEQRAAYRAVLANTVAETTDAVTALAA